MNRPRVLLADDHRGVAEALKGILSREFDVVGTVEDGLTLLDAAADLDPDVIVSDISMPRLDGLKALAQLKQRNPAVKVVLITMFQEAAVAAIALKSGAFGLVLKHSAQDELIPAVRAALAGKTYVSSALASKSAV